MQQRSLGLTLILFMVVFGSAHADDSGCEQPQLVVEQSGVLYNVWVEGVDSTGSTYRYLVRQTSAPPSEAGAGHGPNCRAAFVRWDEPDSGAWFAYTRDGGATWPPGRRIGTALRLRTGALEPDDTPLFVPPSLRLRAAGRLFVVQFRTASLPEWRRVLNNMGAQVEGYIPHNAHIVRMG